MTDYEGFVEDLDETLYHSLPGLSSTGAKKILQSAAHYREYADTEQEPNAAYEVGSAVHSKLLGIGAQVEVYPKDVLSKAGTTGTNAAREWAEKVRKAGNIPLKRDDFDQVQRMAESVLANPTAKTLLEGGVPELSMFATDPKTGTALRGRLDYRRSNAIVDLKTTSRDASESGFQGDVYEHGYDVQFGLYEFIYELITGESAPPWLWIVVEKSRPYLAAVHTLGDDEKDMGRRKARRAIDRYARCLETDEWPGYEHSTRGPIGLIKAPAWAIYQFIDQYEGHSA